MYAGILVAMDIKWRLSTSLPLEQEDDLSEVASTFAQDLPNVSSCNCLQFGRESVHLCK